MTCLDHKTPVQDFVIQNLPVLCYSYVMVGRPATGQTPVRTVRLGGIWDEVQAAARDDGEKVAIFVERALRAELDRRVRRLKRQATT